jgi:hypothetical protein
LQRREIAESLGGANTLALTQSCFTAVLCGGAAFALAAETLSCRPPPWHWHLHLLCVVEICCLRTFSFRYRRHIAIPVVEGDTCTPDPRPARSPATEARRVLGRLRSGYRRYGSRPAVSGIPRCPGTRDCISARGLSPGDANVVGRGSGGTRPDSRCARYVRRAGPPRRATR